MGVIVSQSEANHVYSMGLRNHPTVESRLKKRRVRSSKPLVLQVLKAFVLYFLVPIQAFVYVRLICVIIW